MLTLATAQALIEAATEEAVGRSLLLSFVVVDAGGMGASGATGAEDEAVVRAAIERVL
jgi:uncharacterized protein GlcG (DUF336 family)